SSGGLLALARAPAKRAQLVLGALEPAAPVLRQLLPGAVDVEDQHRHRRAERLRLAALAPLRRTAQGAGDRSRIGPGEDARVEVDRVALARDPLRPAVLPLRRHVAGTCKRRARAQPRRAIRYSTWRRNLCPSGSRGWSKSSAGSWLMPSFS